MKEDNTKTEVLDSEYISDSDFEDCDMDRIFAYLRTISKSLQRRINERDELLQRRGLGNESIRKSEDSASL